MRRRALHAQHAIGKINVTPMIDVVMCLIIFYLIVGRLAAQRISLPKAGAGVTEAGPKPLVIEVAPEGAEGARITIADRPVEAGALESVVREAAGPGSNRAVEIRASHDMPYARLSPVLRACRAAGLTSVHLAAEKKQ